MKQQTVKYASGVNQLVVTAGFSVTYVMERSIFNVLALLLTLRTWPRRSGCVTFALGTRKL